MMIFKAAVTDAGVFQMQQPLKQLMGCYLGRVDVKFIFGVLTKGFDADGVSLNG